MFARSLARAPVCSAREVQRCGEARIPVGAERRQHLGCDHLRRLRLRQRLARHLTREQPRPTPARAHARRNPQPHRGTRPLLGAVLVRLGHPGRLERSRIYGSHFARERARRQPLREIQPDLVVFRLGDPAQQARLRPREIPREKRRVDARQPAQLAIDVREVLDLARGEAEPLDRVVARPHVAEPIPRLPGDELSSQRRQHASHRRRRARERREADLRIGRVERPHECESFHTILVGTERVRADEREDRAWV
jgi:hypothetical protein